MSRQVTIIDYGMGNIRSVTRALEHCGARVTLSESPRDVESAEVLVLPGVGAFRDAIAELKRREYVDVIRAAVTQGKPLLGICLGMQLLLDSSEEFGQHRGLGLIPGQVLPIPLTAASGVPHKIPHIGWNKLCRAEGGGNWDEGVLAGIPENAYVYFVHSFTAFPDDPKHRLADAYYNGRRISAIVQSGALVGCQFHPEKSGPLGLKIIENFLKL